MVRMILVNKWDEEVCELVTNEIGSYKVKDADMCIFKYLDEGDEYRVKAVWSED